MSGFVLRRLGFAVVTLFAVLTIVFFIVRILPGDPAMVILGDQASMQAIEALRARLGLDRPLPVQYLEFMAGVLTGNWGTSMVSGRPVIAEILKVLPATLELTFVSLVLGAIIGVPLGVWSAVRRNQLPDYVTRLASLLGLSFPAFVSAVLLLLVFAIQLNWFPVISSGQGTTFADRMRDLALPAINLGLIMAAYITRVSRSSMLEVLGQDYVRTAQAKGIAFATIIWRHCLRNSMIPVVTFIGADFGALLGGAIVTEGIFNIAGFGGLIYQSIRLREGTTVVALVTVLVLIFLLVNLFVDLLYGLIDPRIRYE